MISSTVGPWTEHSLPLLAGHRGDPVQSQPETLPEPPTLSAVKISPELPPNAENLAEDKVSRTGGGAGRVGGRAGRRVPVGRARDAAFPVDAAALATSFVRNRGGNVDFCPRFTSRVWYLSDKLTESGAPGRSAQAFLIFINIPRLLAVVPTSTASDDSPKGVHFSALLSTYCARKIPTFWQYDL